MTMCNIFALRISWDNNCLQRMIFMIYLKPYSWLHNNNWLRHPRLTCRKTKQHKIDCWYHVIDLLFVSNVRFQRISINKCCNWYSVEDSWLFSVFLDINPYFLASLSISTHYCFQCCQWLSITVYYFRLFPALVDKIRPLLLTNIWYHCCISCDLLGFCYCYFYWQYLMERAN